MVLSFRFLFVIGVLLSASQALGQSSEVADDKPTSGVFKVFRVAAPEGARTVAPVEKNPLDKLATRSGKTITKAGNKYALKAVDFCGTTSIGMSFGLSKKTRCDFKAYLHPATETFINKYLHECTVEGLKLVGVDRQPVRVVIDTMSLYTDKNVSDTSKPSQHSIGNAIDIHQLEIEFADGTKSVYPTAAVNRNNKNFNGFQRCTSGCGDQRFKKTGQAMFYVGFKACLDRRVATEKAGRKCSGGVLGCDTNTAHHNHIHLSAPICPAPKGISTI